MVLNSKPWLAFGAFARFTVLATIFLSTILIIPEIRQLDGSARISETQMIGRDFVNIWHGGKLAADDAAGVYDREAYRASLKQAADIEGIYAFPYPPHMLMASIPFGQVPYWVALLAWTVMTAGLFWHASRPFLASVGLPSWSILMLPAFWINLWAGHFGCLVGAGVLYGWHHARNRPSLSGLAFAAMTVKPHLGILVPFVLAARKSWRAIFWSAGMTAMLILLSGYLLGWQSWTVWLQSTLPSQTSLLEPTSARQLYLLMMPTVGQFGASLGLSGSAGIALSVAFAVSAIALLVTAWRKGLALGDLGLLSIIATFLLLPYAFVYDMVAYDLALLVLATRIRAEVKNWEAFILALAFLLPLFHVFVALKYELQAGPVLILATLWILVRHLRAHETSRA